jgi:uncharacterized protein YdiU (UPF0061 family)
VDTLLQLMEENKADYTNTFAALTLNKVSDDSLFTSNQFNDWRKQWGKRTNHTDKQIEILKLMQAQNPLFIPRNHLVESALEDAIQGNKSQFNELLNLISKPYDYKPNHNNFQTIPSGFDDCYKTFCGT